MFYNKQELKNLFHRIGGAMLLFFILFMAFCNSTAALKQSLVSAFPNAAGVYIVTDLLCSIAYILSFTLPVGFFFLISKNAKIQPIRLNMTFTNSHSVLACLALVFLGASICFCCSYINSLLFPIPDTSYGAVNTPELDKAYKLVLMFISTAIVPAFVEELLFRGLILSQLRPFNESAAVLISAVLFGLMHQNPVQFFYTTAVGIVFGAIYIKTESIWFCVLMHFFNNFLAVLQTYVVGNSSAHIGELFSVFLYGSVILFSIIFGVTLYIIAKRRVPNISGDEIGIYRQKESKVTSAQASLDLRTVLKAALSPTLLIFVGLSVIMILAYMIIYYKI